MCLKDLSRNGIVNNDIGIHTGDKKFTIIYVAHRSNPTIHAAIDSAQKPYYIKVNHNWFMLQMNRISIEGTTYVLQ